MVMDVLHHVNKTFGRTIILVTHEPTQAEQADVRVIMQDGRVQKAERLDVSPTDEVRYTKGENTEK
jgi:ABC-type lipoprotein export system ATPase subunit